MAVGERGAPATGDSATFRSAAMWKPSMQSMLDTALARAPAGWSTATLRLPERPGSGATVLFLLPDQTPRLGTSVALKPDGSFAEVKLPRQDLAFRLRAILRPVHTGEFLGVPGQLIMALASLATLVLVWTGVAMSWRRFFRRRVAQA